MRENRLLLQRYTAKPQRPHNGKVITLRSNLRWCSDAFEIVCWNGERIQVAFSLDCCDREILGFVSTTPVGITGEMIRDLMLDSISHRFGEAARCVAHPIEWLSDNGSCYTALETRRFANTVGLCRVQLLPILQKATVWQKRS